MRTESYDAFTKRIDTMSEEQLMDEVDELLLQLFELEEEFSISIPDSQGEIWVFEPQGRKGGAGKFYELISQRNQLDQKELLRFTAEALYRIVVLESYIKSSRSH